MDGGIIDGVEPAFGDEKLKCSAKAKSPFQP